MKKYNLIVLFLIGVLFSQIFIKIDSKELSDAISKNSIKEPQVECSYNIDSEGNLNINILDAIPSNNIYKINGFKYGYRNKDNSEIIDENKLIGTSYIFTNNSFNKKNFKDAFVIVYDNNSSSKRFCSKVYKSSNYVNDSKGKKIRNVNHISSSNTLMDLTIKKEILSYPKYNTKSIYYVSLIKTTNPYNQLNKVDLRSIESNIRNNVLNKDSNKNGIKFLAYPTNMLKGAILEQYKSSYNNMILAFNGSGYYLNEADGVDVDDNKIIDKFGQEWLNQHGEYSQWTTGKISIATTGYKSNDPNRRKVSIRNYAQPYVVFGVDKNNHFNYQKINDNDTSNVLKFKNSTMRNTFSYNPVIIENYELTSNLMAGKQSNGWYEKNARQVLCSVSDTEFVLLTSAMPNGKYSSYKKEKNGISLIQAANILKEYNCKTAINLDGSESAALLYKPINSDKIQIIAGNKRKIAEIGYFSS